MRRYSNYDELTYAADNKTIVGLSCGTAARAHLYKAIFSCSDAPADVQVTVDIKYSSAVNGTSSSSTSEPLDLGDPAANANGRINYSAEPTYNTLPMVKLNFHQANTYRYEELPEDGLVMPATSGAGAGCRIVTVSGGTPTVCCNIFHAE